MREEDVVIPVKKNLMEGGMTSYSERLNYDRPAIETRSNSDDRRPDDDLSAVKGIMMGILLSIPIWMLILYLVFK
jgi:hypothetical protein